MLYGKSSLKEVKYYTLDWIMEQTSLVLTGSLMGLFLHGIFIKSKGNYFKQEFNGILIHCQPPIKEVHGSVLFAWSEIFFVLFFTSRRWKINHSIPSCVKWNLYNDHPITKYSYDPNNL